MTTLTPRDGTEVEQAVRDALAAGQPLEIVGHGTRRAIGHAVATNAVLDLSALNAVVDYEPSELLITVQAGAPLADVLSLIDARNQEFAFDPVDTSVLLGTPQGRGTVGGMIGAGLAGPRRIRAGGVRDHLLGALGVSGFGESFKAGGKVVKNVTGYDLCKLLAGSWGTLSVMTEATLKVMPRAESETTLILPGLDAASANRAMTTAVGSPFDVSGAAHLPQASSVLAGSQGAATLLRLEGTAVSVAHRVGTLRALLAPFGAVEIIADEASRPVWQAIRDVAPFALSGPLGDRVVWRIACPPAAGAAIGKGLQRTTGGEVIYDWGGGLIWLAVSAAHDGFEGAVRAPLKAAGAHATLIRGSEELRSRVPVFEPMEAGVAALNRRLKASFDPKALFNRGRMSPEIIA